MAQRSESGKRHMRCSGGRNSFPFDSYGHQLRFAGASASYYGYRSVNYGDDGS